MTNSSTRISRSEVVDLCETIHASGPLSVFGARALGLFLCVRLRGCQIVCVRGVI